MRALALLVITACGARSAPTPVPTPPAPPSPDAAAATPPLDASPPDAVPVTTTVPPGALPTVALEPPPLTGPRATVDEGATVRLDGVAIELRHSNHKHPARGGRALGMWTFAIGGAELELSSEDTGFEAEVAAGGRLYVLRHLGYRQFEVVLAARRAPAPLDDEACAARIDAAARTAGLPEPRARSYGQRNGVVELEARLDATRGWTGRCGIYTQRIWLHAPVAFATRDDDPLGR